MMVVDVDREKRVVKTRDPGGVRHWSFADWHENVGKGHLVEVSRPSPPTAGPENP